jgi:hypothetical protein
MAQRARAVWSPKGIAFSQGSSHICSRSVTFGDCVIAGTCVATATPPATMARASSTQPPARVTM